MFGKDIRNVRRSANRALNKGLTLKQALQILVLLLVLVSVFIVSVEGVSGLFKRLSYFTFSAVSQAIIILFLVYVIKVKLIK